MCNEKLMILVKKKKKKNFIWSTTCAQCTFLNIEPKMCFNVNTDEDCMIFE